MFSFSFRFASDTLFGLAKELSPVYFHILQKYRRKYPKSKLGLSTMDNGNQGYNSGVVLMDVEKLRHSIVYKNVTKKSFVQYLSSKYSFVVSCSSKIISIVESVKSQFLFEFKICCESKMQLSA